ncbi:MAG: hypothetical protein M1821_009802 [Bathelium mastoideum]|nr:MAG: hypothetical protein M1821_009802 [Bathelium mastoideum]
MKIAFLLTAIGPLINWVSAQGQSGSSAAVHQRQVSGILALNYPSSTSYTIPNSPVTSTPNSSSLTPSSATPSTCPATITSTIYPSGYSPSSISTTTSTTIRASSSSPSSTTSTSSSPSSTASCAAADPNPQCPSSAGETALTLNQYYRVICGGYYGASILLTNTSHAAPYPLASCVSECVNYNVAGLGASQGTGNCSMVVLEPPSSGAGRSSFNCFSFAGLISEDFAAANTLEWATGVLLTQWEATQALCAPGPSV